jgi:Mn-dependent DtxR family transcriptional regulator
VNDFYTFREYMNRVDEKLTASAEDYLEMICRLSKDKGYTRVSELSAALNVQPPAATRMVQKLAEMKLIKYEKYGVLVMDETGKQLGGYLLQRHGIVEEFLKMLGVGEERLLEATEKIEHTIDKETLRCISLFLEFTEENPRFLAAYQIYKNQNGCQY